MKSYRVIKDDIARRMVRDGMFIAQRKPHIKASFTIDITLAHAKLKQAKHNHGIKLTLMGYFIYAYTQMLQAFPEINAMLDYKSDLYVFKHTDILIPIAIEYNNRPAIKYEILRKTDMMSLKELGAKLNELTSKRNLNDLPKSHLYFLRLPSFIRKLAYRLWEAFPGQFKLHLGTGVLSNVNTPSSSFEGLPLHTSGIFMNGGSSRTVNGNTQMTLSALVCLDHNVADGATLLQMGKFFKDYIEGGNGLEQLLEK